MKLPIRPTRDRWPKLLQERGDRYFYTDPDVLVDPDADPGKFRRAMFGVHLGGTIKITWAGRHAEADQLLVEAVDLTDADIVDIGASDGSTSLDLIKVAGDFRSFTVADLFLSLQRSTALGHSLFYDADGECVLIGGRWFVAWPSMSGFVQSAYYPLLKAAEDKPREEVLLLNPELRREMATDARIRATVHDVFETFESPVDVIKVGNLLRRLYFDDATIVRGLQAVHASLREGGVLVLADDSRVKEEPTAAGIYRKVDDHFERIAATTRIPEVDALALGIRVAAQ